MTRVSWLVAIWLTKIVIPLTCHYPMRLWLIGHFSARFKIFFAHELHGPQMEAVARSMPIAISLFGLLPSLGQSEHEPLAPPQPRIPPEQRIRLKWMTYIDGSAVGIRLDAGVVNNSESVSAMIDQAIETRVDPPELIALGEQIVTNGFDLACEFIDILRQDFDQYWLPMPETTIWEYLGHYSAPRSKWYTLVLSKELSERLEERRRGNYWYASQVHYVPKVIGNADMETLNAAELNGRWTFADEMLATALVELHQGRVRSAILHAIIGYESASKRALEELMENKLRGLESAAIVDAITREVSTATLGRVVLFHAEEDANSPPLDWEKIENLYNTRNQIVHRGQRRMPAYEILRDQVIEVRSFVRRVQAALRRSAVSWSAGGSDPTSPGVGASAAS
jgi:hypothetical protein